MLFNSLDFSSFSSSFFSPGRYSVRKKISAGHFSSLPLSSSMAGGIGVSFSSSSVQD